MWWIILFVVLVLIILFVKKDELTGRFRIPQDDWSPKNRFLKRILKDYNDFDFGPPERNRTNISE